MTKEEFIQQYAKRSEMTVEELLKDMVALPCICNGESCKGWAMVGNSPLSIKAHNSLYNNENTLL